MTEKKPSLLDRLLGAKQPPPFNPPPVPSEVKAGEEPPPGPPETTVEYIKEKGAEPEASAAAPAPKKQNWFQRLASGLKRSSDQLTAGITAVFTKKRLDEAMLGDLEDLLIQSDFGVDMAETIVGALRRDRFDRDITADEVRALLADEVSKVLAPVAVPFVVDASKKPFVILMVGVNGTGKTTTTGKLAQDFAEEGKSVILAAGDTFRAAAIDQLKVWGERTGASI
jgi:fused signal recognition particle receptor